MAFICFAIVILLSTLQLEAEASASSDDLSQIIISPESLLVFTGKSVFIPCVAFIHGNDAAHTALSWRKDGSLVNLSPRVIPHEPVVTNKSGILFVMVVLQVCNVSPSDSGNYSCLLRVNDEYKQFADFQITVSSDSAPTQIVVAPDPIEVSANETVLVTCIAFGLPSPVITWTRNDYALTSTASVDTATIIHSEVYVRGNLRLVKSTLEICNVQGIASGEYKCLAGNGISSDNVSFAITREAPIKFLAGPLSVRVDTGTEVNFTCDFRSTPLPTITWSGVPLTSAGRFSVHQSVVNLEGVLFMRSTLSIAPVAEYDGGEISCTATNVLDVQSHSIGFSVVVPPIIVISPKDTRLIVNGDHHTLTLPCVSLTTERLIWKKGDTEMVAGDSVRFNESSFERKGQQFVVSVMEICGVSADDSGVYSCMAEDAFGRIVATTFDLCVIASTGLVVTPSNHTLPVNHSLSLPCVAYSTITNASLTSVSWSTGNTDLVNSSKVTIHESYENRGGVVFIRSILLISCVEAEDAAQYACHVTAGGQRTTAEFTVDVQVPPILKEHPQHIYISGKGDMASLTCLASGNPLPSITWFKDDSQFQADANKRITIKEEAVRSFVSGLSEAVMSTLTIVLAVEEDSGQYSCQALNSLGTAELQTMYTLTIVDPVLSVSDGVSVNTVSMGITLIGAVVSFLCLLVVFILHILISSLRILETTPPLLNTSLSLMALNISFIISYNTIEAGNACVFFSALFQYFFLAAMLAVSNLVFFKAKKRWASRKHKLLAYGIAFSFNWGTPLIVVVLSLAPDLANYTGSVDGHFCVPTLWPYWLGILFPFGAIHLCTWCAFSIISILNKPCRDSQLDRTWLYDTITIALTLLLFDISWGIGLPATQQISIALQSLFSVFTAILGVSILLLYCLLSSAFRQTLTKATQKNVSPNSPKIATITTSHIQTVDKISQGLPSILRLRKEGSQLSLSGIDAAKELYMHNFMKDEFPVGTPPRALITSFSEENGNDDLGNNPVDGRRDSVMGPQVVNVRLPRELDSSGV